MKEMFFAPQGLTHYDRKCEYSSENVMIEYGNSIFTVFKSGGYICERGKSVFFPELDSFAFSVAQTLLKDRKYYNVVRLSYLAIVVHFMLGGV